MDGELMRVFVTMGAKADMTLFAWRWHVEELRHAVADSVKEEDWGWFRIYGPDSGGFDQLPGICLEAQVTEAALGAMMEYLSGCELWLQLPIQVFVGRSMINE